MKSKIDINREHWNKWQYTHGGSRPVF